MTGLRRVFSNHDFVPFFRGIPLFNCSSIFIRFSFQGHSLEVKIFFRVIILLFSELHLVFLQLPFSQKNLILEKFHFPGICPVLIILWDL